MATTWRAEYLDDFAPRRKTKHYPATEEGMEELRRDLEEKKKTRDDSDGDEDSRDWVTYSFPDLGLSSTGQYRSYIEARRSAEDTIFQEEADGDIFDPFTNGRITPERTPYYDDGRPEGYHGPSPKDYRWKEMYRYWKKMGRRLTREETDAFEKDPLYETDWEGNVYDRKAMVAYAWEKKRQLTPEEYDMFLIKKSGEEHADQDDDWIPLF